MSLIFFYPSVGINYLGRDAQQPSVRHVCVCEGVLRPYQIRIWGYVGLKILFGCACTNTYTVMADGGGC